MSKILDVIVVGAGHAGLSASYHLKKSGLQHLVLEKGRIGESWLSQRWDSFRMNTANKLNTLPGSEIAPLDGENFGSALSLAAGMKNFALDNSLPVIEHTKVLSVDKITGEELFQVKVLSKGLLTIYLSRAVVVASGDQTEKKHSLLASKISSKIRQIHSSEYRNTSDLLPGGVLIVGSGQSGCQVAEELATAGRKVFLSTSKVPRCPRRYRGKDIMDWLIAARFFDTPPEEITNPAMLHLPTPLLKGTGGGQQTLSLQTLAKQGVILLGRLKDAADHFVSFQNDLTDNVAFGDAFSSQVKMTIDAFIEEHQLHTPAAETDPNDETGMLVTSSETPLSFDLEKRNITNIIWANGFKSDFSYIKLPVFDTVGKVVHHHGAAAVPGLYFLGLHWLRSRKSNILFGITADAAFIVNCILAGHRSGKVKEAQPKG